MKTFICVSLSPSQLSRLRSAVQDIDIRFHPEPESDAKARTAFNECEIAFGNPPAAWIPENPYLTWVQLESVGFGEYARLDWRRLGKNLKLTNLPGFFAEPVAQSILAGVLSHYRGVGTLAIHQERRAWLGDALRPSLRTLKGANVVLFGMGSINRRVAQLLAPFECNITAFGRGWTKAALERALGDADILIAAVPHTGETVKLFDRSLIGKLKRGALFVNFGRGSLVDEEALADALESGALGGAVIDVTADEPLPADHRFWACENMLLTQHTGGGTENEVDRKIDVFIANLERYRRYEAPIGLVDFARGY